MADDQPLYGVLYVRKADGHLVRFDVKLLDGINIDGSDDDPRWRFTMDSTIPMHTVTTARQDR